MILVAQKSKVDVRVSIKQIAEGIDAPEPFIAKILQDLGKRKLISSVKGPNGGFYIDQSNIKCSVADVVKAIDGDGIYKDCVIGLKACSEKNPCPIHFEYKEIKKNLITMLEENTIADFNDKLDTGQFFLKNQ